MAEILINRCTVRVVRRNGWSWGDDPGRLVRRLVRDLPALLEEKLAAMFSEDGTREFASPIRLRIPVRMSDLSTGPARAAEVRGLDRQFTATAFEQKLDRSLRAAFGQVFDPAPEPKAENRFDTSSIAVNSPGSVTDTAGDLSPGLLPHWAKAGVLEQRLRASSDALIHAWHDILRRDPRGHGQDAAQPVGAEGSRIDETVRHHPLLYSGASGIVRFRQRIQVAIEVAARVGIAVDHPQIWRAIDRHMPVESAPWHDTGARQGEVLANTGLSGRYAAPLLGQLSVLAGLTTSRALETANPSAREPIYDRATEYSTAAWDVKIGCALPYLLLGPLHRMGYLSAVAATLEAGRMSGDAPLFAAALVYKLLDPPDRGWRRGARQVLAAAAFAGSREAVDEAALVDFSRRIAPHMEPLDLVLADAVMAGHVSGRPVALCRAHSGDEAGLLLVDTPVGFPIAHRPDVAALLPLLRRLGAPVLMISGETAASSLLSDLDGAGQTFVTDVPPTRHELWARIQQGTQQIGWTNSSEPDGPRIIDAARALAAACNQAAELWRELSIRPGIVRAHSPALDRGLTIAAAVAMGAVAWDIWNDAGEADPLRPLHRYRDLDARIRFDSVSVQVSLPLGRRHQELEKAGLLAPIDGVPWLGGRRVEFSGG